MYCEKKTDIHNFKGLVFILYSELVQVGLKYYILVCEQFFRKPIYIRVATIVRSEYNTCRFPARLTV